MAAMPRNSLLVFPLATALAGVGCSQPVEPADLVLLHGTVVTMDEARPGAQALAIRADRIVAVGSDREIRRWIGPRTEILDLAGRLAVPGFVDSHAHLVGLGRALMNLRLEDARTWDEAVARVAAAAERAAPGEWILGRGWHQEKWDARPDRTVEGYPVHDRLSAAVPDNPVLLRHASGHAAMVNARAMELAGIDRQTPDPPGGIIMRDERGDATGVLRETAEDLADEAYRLAVSGRTAEQRRAELRRAVGLAVDECLAKGVTSFQDAGSSFEVVDVLREMADRGELEMRLWVMLREENEVLEKGIAGYRMIDHGGHHLTVRAIKRYVDGALGSHGAWMLEPYEDLPQTSGLNTDDLGELGRAGEIAIEHGFQLCTHAIGDRGNRETLDVYERLLDGVEGGRELRWRIEHAQHLHPDDIPRFADLGVVAAMQAVHCTSDGPWVAERIGRRRAAEGAYAWRSLLDAGTVIAIGTDAPIEDVNPLAGFHAAVTRKPPGGEPFFPEQRMTREEALRAYTLHAAYAAFEEEQKGSLVPGKLADVVVLSRNIMTVPEEEIPGTEVVLTIVGGKVVFRR